MAKARYLVEAHVVEGRSVKELAASHGVHRSWIYKLLARYREGGYEARKKRALKLGMKVILRLVGEHYELALLYQRL